MTVHLFLEVREQKEDVGYHIGAVKIEINSLETDTLIASMHFFHEQLSLDLAHPHPLLPVWMLYIEF